MFAMAAVAGVEVSGNEGEPMDPKKRAAPSTAFGINQTSPRLSTALECYDIE